jgi:dCTP deaminase
VILNDWDLMELGAEIVQPFDPARVQPASYDLTLGDDWVAFDEKYPHNGIIDLAEDQTGSCRRIHGNGLPYHLVPGGMVLAHTAETVSCPANMAARVEGKSSLGRLGLFVHITAGFIDPGFSGHVTLELFNARKRTMRLYPRMPIAQLTFIHLSGEAMSPYGQAGLGSKYQGDQGPQPSQFHRNFPLEAR